MMIVFVLFTFIEIKTELYIFDEGYCEFWYKIPVSHIFSMDEISGKKDTLIKEYSYEIIIFAQNHPDSTFKKGIKRAAVIAGKKTDYDYIIDYFPLYMSEGRFKYRFSISSYGEAVKADGEFEVLPDTATFYLSDPILANKNFRDSVFMRNGIPLIPLINPEYSNRDTLFSYIEVYGLVPDSLFYEIYYKIKDSLSNILLEKSFVRPKYEYKQFDTFSIYLGDYSSGSYTLNITIYEPALSQVSIKDCSFQIKERLPDITEMPYAWEIEYLVSEKEYKNFCDMDYAQQVQYLKRFWAKRNYQEFERRLLEADARFFTSFKKGRDTPMGRFYILNGPPDEVRHRVMAIGGSAAKYKRGYFDENTEVWVYESKGVEVIFMDDNRDGIFELKGSISLRYENDETLKDREELRKLLYKQD